MRRCKILYKSCTSNYLFSPQNNPQGEPLLLSIPILHMRLLGQGKMKKNARLVSAQASQRKGIGGFVCS